MTDDWRMWKFDADAEIELPEPKAIVSLIGPDDRVLMQFRFSEGSGYIGFTEPMEIHGIAVTT